MLSVCCVYDEREVAAPCLALNLAFPDAFCSCWGKRGRDAGKAPGCSLSRIAFLLWPSDFRAAAATAVKSFSFVHPSLLCVVPNLIPRSVRILRLVGYRLFFKKKLAQKKIQPVPNFRTGSALIRARKGARRPAVRECCATR